MKFGLSRRERQERGAAWTAVFHAVKEGRLVPQPCRYRLNGGCNGRVEAHHHLGYATKHHLDVEWYCHRHHMWQHREGWMEGRRRTAEAIRGSCNETQRPDSREPGCGVNS